MPAEGRGPRRKVTGAARVAWPGAARGRPRLRSRRRGVVGVGRALIAAAARADRRWLARARPLGAGAPAWAVRMRERSLLVLRALTDRRSGAMAAGIRDGWAYVWPRDAAAAAIAFAGAGYRREARRISDFLASLDPGAAARFDGDRSPVDGRGAQGDEAGWIRAAALAAGRRPPRAAAPTWRSSADYGERAGDSGDYLANAIAAGLPAARLRSLFGTPAGLVRRAGDPASASRLGRGLGRSALPAACPGRAGAPLAALAARRRGALRDRALRGLARRGPVERAHRMVGLGAGGARRPEGGREAAGGSAPRRDPGRDAARAGRGRHRDPPLHDSSGLVARVFLAGAGAALPPPRAGG